MNPACSTTPKAARRHGLVHAPTGYDVPQRDPPPDRLSARFDLHCDLADRRVRARAPQPPTAVFCPRLSGRMFLAALAALAASKAWSGRHCGAPGDPICRGTARRWRIRSSGPVHRTWSWPGDALAAGSALAAAGVIDGSHGASPELSPHQMRQVRHRIVRPDLRARDALGCRSPGRAAGLARGYASFGRSGPCLTDAEPA